jgi:hypothetical protein
MPLPRTLLLTGATPFGRHAGGLILQDAARCFPAGRLAALALSRDPRTPVPEDWAGVPLTRAPYPRETGWTGVHYRFTQLSTLPVHAWLRGVWARQWAPAVIRVAEEHHAELVWALLDSPAAIVLARQVVRRLRVPLVATVLDPPERTAADYALDPLSRHLLLRDFAAVLVWTRRCGVASEPMAEEYRRRYGVDPVVLIHGVHPRLRRPPAAPRDESSPFVIGFAGSLYATEEFKALLEALGSSDWRLAGREVIVRLVGGHVWAECATRARIEYLGWRPLEETLALMADCDVTYLPYWFNPRYRTAVRLCFPNKLSTYLAAGRPVFYHGPMESSAARFFERYPVGVCCHALAPPVITVALLRLATDQALYAAAVAAGQRALDQELGLPVFRRRLAEMLGSTEEDLCPP